MSADHDNPFSAPERKKKRFWRLPSAKGVVNILSAVNLLILFCVIWGLTNMDRYDAARIERSLPDEGLLREQLANTEDPAKLREITETMLELIDSDQLSSIALQKKLQLLSVFVGFLSMANLVFIFVLYTRLQETEHGPYLT